MEKMREYDGVPIRQVDKLTEATRTTIDTTPRQLHPDPVVEALMQQAWEGPEPLNAYDDAERIVAIVRKAMAASNPTVSPNP